MHFVLGTERILTEKDTWVSKDRDRDGLEMWPSLLTDFDSEEYGDQGKGFSFITLDWTQGLEHAELEGNLGL